MPATAAAMPTKFMLNLTPSENIGASLASFISLDWSNPFGEGRKSKSSGGEHLGCHLHKGQSLELHHRQEKRVL